MNTPPKRHRFRNALIALGCLLGLVLAAGLSFVRWSPDIFRPEPTYHSDQLLPFFKATEWTLFSLSPRRVYSEESSASSQSTPTNPDLFYERPALGKLTTPVTADIRSIVTDLDHAGRNWSGAVAACFSPRHGVRAVVDGTVNDLLICYECASAEIYKDSVQVGTIYLSSDRYDGKQNERFNSILNAAGIPTEPPPQESPPSDAPKQ